MSLNDEIKKLLKTGKYHIGSKKTIKSLKLGKIKGLVIAMNSPKEVVEDIKYYSKFTDASVIKYLNNSLELGAICGVPYSVCTIGIIDPGQSKILSMKEESFE